MHLIKNFVTFWVQPSMPVLVSWLVYSSNPTNLYVDWYFKPHLILIWSYRISSWIDSMSRVGNRVKFDCIGLGSIDCQPDSWINSKFLQPTYKAGNTMKWDLIIIYEESKPQKKLTCMRCQ